MAPGQILIELVLPVASVAATILGAFIVKKRRDKKKAEACKIDAADGHRLRIETLENAVNTLTHSVLVCSTEEKVEGQIREANDRLRLDIAAWDENKSSKGEMERHVDEACRILRVEFQTLVANATNSVQDDLENKMINTAKKIGEDAERDVEVDMVDVRKEINKKLQEYDLAITKWIGKKMEDYQLTLQGAFAAAQHDVKEDDSEAMCDASDDIEPDDDDTNPY